MTARCWLAGNHSATPADHPAVTDDHGRTWTHVHGEIYQEERSGRRATFAELVRRTDLVETRRTRERA